MVIARNRSQLHLSFLDDDHKSLAAALYISLSCDPHRNADHAAYIVPKSPLES